MTAAPLATAVRGTVTHVCRVAALQPDIGTIGVTAIDKRPADEPVRVGTYGLRGDVQADREHHGGPEKALYAYTQAEADHWGAELGEEIWPGRFGENLRVTCEATLEDAVIGERWRIGEHVEVEVTGPRTPCATFGRWLDQEGWVRRFTERGRTGVYLRVLRGGPLAPGDDIVLLDRPTHRVTVGGWFAGRDPEDARRLLAHEATGWRMADYLRAYVVVAAAREAHRAGSA